MYKINANGIEYYTIDRIKDIQDQMFRLLRIVDFICRENHLQYFLDGGSAIGAYRHGGFIPWDDDLDIALLKPDYLKLIDILKTMDHSKYFLFDYDYSHHCCGFFGEIIPLLLSGDGKKRHVYPIKIDIRPLNVIENNQKSVQKNRIYRELANYLIFGKCSDEYKKLALNCYDKDFGSDKKVFLTFYNTQYGLYRELDKAVLVHPYMEYSTEKKYTYDQIFPLKEIKFLNLDTFVPATDILLTEIYGNYMEMPYLEKRRPEASKVFNTIHPELLYKYLIDKTKSSFIQKLSFSLRTIILCK